MTTAEAARLLLGWDELLLLTHVRPDGDTIVCRCEEITAAEIRGLAALGCPGPNQMKAFTRCGMGPCQGRWCGATVGELIADGDWPWTFHRAIDSCLFADRGWALLRRLPRLDQVLTAEQYEKNVATRPNSNERVEFAIRLPGHGKRGSDSHPVWLPIDAKFPIEDYQRLVEAQDRADPVAVEAAAKALEVRLRDEAKKIRDKYVEPPHTTDFAILYLPTEGLYAEVLRRPGLADALQRDYRVSLAGPTTLTALLNSLQMGFRTLAIEKRSSEVWAVLGAVKTEFGKFGEVLEATRKKLEQATKSIESAGVRTRQIERKLKGVEALPVADAQAKLGDLEDIETAEEA